MSRPKQPAMTKEEFINHQFDGVPAGYTVVPCSQDECKDRCCPGWKVVKDDK